MRPSSIITAVLFAVFLLMVLVWLVANSGPGRIMEAQFHMTQLRHAIGMFIASAAALTLLLRALSGNAPQRMIGLVIAFLAGVLLIEQTWSVALGITLLTLGIAFRNRISALHRQMPVTTAPHEPPVL